MPITRELLAASLSHSLLVRLSSFLSSRRGSNHLGGPLEVSWYPIGPGRQAGLRPTSFFAQIPASGSSGALGGKAANLMMTAKNLAGTRLSECCRVEGRGRGRGAVIRSPPELRLRCSAQQRRVQMQVFVLRGKEGGSEGAREVIWDGLDMSVKRQCQIRNPGWAHLSSPAWRAVTSAVPCAEVGRDVRFVLSESTILLSFTVSVCQVVRRGPLFSRFALASRLALAHDDRASCPRSKSNDIGFIAVSSHTERREARLSCRACRIFHVAGRVFCGLLSQTIRGTSAAAAGAPREAVAQKRD